MRFYNREKEQAKLLEIKEKSLERAQLTFMVGRRRVGKTRLIHAVFPANECLYFFVAKKSEALLCEEFTAIIATTLHTPIFGNFTRFTEIIGYLLEVSKNQPLTLIIDEFQEFQTVNPSVYSDMQRLWDQYREQSKLNLICCGSIYSLMQKIFMDEREPLFGRADNRLVIQPFSIDALKLIFQENNPKYAQKDLLALYVLTGGIPKYVEYFIENKAFTFKKMLTLCLDENSILIDEGKNVLIEEFGRDYVTYFSILSLIASSKTSRPEIESILGVSVGVYLEKLENDFGIIKKIRPIFGKTGSRMVKYQIEDNFLNFWFRFIFKNKSAIEIGNFAYVQQIIERDFDTYSGRLLEKYFVNRLAQENKYAAIGNYWERGNTNEIDIVAVDEWNKQIDFIEVKLNAAKINLQELKQKASVLEQKNQGYTFNYLGLSLDDM